jgi:hypothetical protein
MNIKDDSMKTIAFDAKTVAWIKSEVTAGRGSSRGLSEIEVISDTAPTTQNLELR